MKYKMLWGLKPEKLEEKVNQFFEDMEGTRHIIEDCKTRWDLVNKMFIADILYVHSGYSKHLGDKPFSAIINELGVRFTEYLGSIDLSNVIQEFLERN